MTIIYGVACEHANNGGHTRVIVSRGTRHDYPVGNCQEVYHRPSPTRIQKVFDIARGRIGLARCSGINTYRPASAAIESEFCGQIFIHNNPVALQFIKSRHPHASVVLWANNRLFDTYTNRETQRVVDAADCLICCSEYIAKDLRGRIGRGHAKVQVLLNGVDTVKFAPSLKPPGAGVPLVLFVGRMLPTKGPDLLVAAAHRLHAAGVEFKLRLVGSRGFSAADPLTEFETNLRRAAAPLGELVEFAPFTDRVRVADEFHNASIFCVPSNWDDPCPLTVGEGMASGLPIVAARRGGIPELGADAVQYFSPPDVAGLASILQSLLTDSEARRVCGEKARARAEQLSWREQYRRLIQIIGDVATSIAKT